MALSFLMPLGLWAMVSYVPFLWHPLMEIQLGSGSVYAVGDRIPRESWDDLVRADKEWFVRFNDRVLAAGDTIVAQPGQDPISPGRRLARANKKAFYSFAPALYDAGLIEKDHLRDADEILPALQQWQQNDFTPAAWTLSFENKARIALLLDQMAGDEIPSDRLLPSAAPQAFPANPVFLPAPHAVMGALVSAFTTPPLREKDPWLHERLMHSMWIVIKGFGLALLIGLPLGVLAGTFPFFSRLIEPVTNFIGYIPPPAFAALLVAILGLQDGPKVGIVFIASAFPMILMVANSVRGLDKACIEAAQTLGASRRSLVTKVILPGSLPRIFGDIRVLLALGWTILIIAEITGEKSGLSAYMEQQGRYRQYENVFAAMLIIGCIGLIADQLLASLQLLLFPWQGKPAPRWLHSISEVVTYLPRMAIEDGAAKQLALQELLDQRRAKVDEQESQKIEGAQHE